MPIHDRHDLPTIIDGDDVSYNITFTDGNGSSIDITNWELFVTVKDDITDSDSKALISKDITSHDDPTNGKTSFGFTSDETEGLSDIKPYDVQIKKTDGSVQTILRGFVQFESGVTERTA